MVEGGGKQKKKTPSFCKWGAVAREGEIMIKNPTSSSHLQAREAVAREGERYNIKKMPPGSLLHAREAVVVVTCGREAVLKWHNTIYWQLEPVIWGLQHSMSFVWAHVAHQRWDMVKGRWQWSSVH